MYKPENVLNKIVKKFNFSEGSHGNMQASIVECIDGYRMYLMQDGKEIAEKGSDTLDAGIKNIKELAMSTNSTLEEI